MPLFPSPEPSVSCIDDIDFFKDFKNEFPAIVYNDALTCKSDFSTEPTLCPQHIDEFDLNDETSLSEYDEVEQNVFIPFDPKQYYKDGDCTRMLRRPRFPRGAEDAPDVDEGAQAVPAPIHAPPPPPPAAGSDIIKRQKTQPNEKLSMELKRLANSRPKPKMPKSFSTLVCESHHDVRGYSHEIGGFGGGVGECEGEEG
ncbi:hypothetical protein Tco_0477506 [Tanacetum coccineum]